MVVPQVATHPHMQVMQVACIRTCKILLTGFQVTATGSAGTDTPLHRKWDHGMAIPGAQS